jgi:excisionase family DNA binding protein
MANEWITTKEASEILGVSIRTIQRYVKDKKLKSKTINGKGMVKKDVILKLSPDAGNQQVAPENDKKETDETKKNIGWHIPEGYILIDKETLDSLRSQIKSLTDSVGQMQLTQKLLIEKGLNLTDKETQNFLEEVKNPHGLICNNESGRIFKITIIYI